MIEDSGGTKKSAEVSGEVRHWSEDGFSRRECRLALRYEGGELRGVGTDFFSAFCRIREQLSTSGIFPVCYGASRTVYPTGMSRDMGEGLKAYRLRMGRQAQLEDMVHIFDSGPDVELATVEAQKTFAEAWFDQFRKCITATLRQKKWLLREWDVTTPAGDFIVRYSGRGHGYESISVDGAAVAKSRSLVWFVPRLEFHLGDLSASVEVRVWPWFLLRAVRLRVAEQTCYSEGFG